MKSKVSIIVPVYNVEKYISRCIESLCNQDYPNYEVIIVDDGSPDNSPSIVDELKSKYECVKVIHKANGGVSSARNAGLHAADGEWIMFVDGDDWVDSDYVSYFVSLVLDYKTEIGMNINNYSHNNQKSRNNSYSITAEKAIELIYLGDIFVAVWNKIYSRSFLINNNIWFDENIWYGEGMLFNIESLQFVGNVAIGEKSVYHQEFNPDSAMRLFNLDSNLCGIRSLDIQKRKWRIRTPRIEKAWNYHRYCFNRSIVNGIVRSDSIKKYIEVYKECRKNLRREILIPLGVEKGLRKKMGWIGYFISPYLMSVRHKMRFRKTTHSLETSAD